MNKIQKVNSRQLEGKYNKNEMLKILKEIFDSSNPSFTQIRNPKMFQIKLTEKEFKIRKIDKLVDSSDPSYMALTQIKGVLKNEGEDTSITLFAEIHLAWLIYLIIGLIAGVFTSLVFNSQLIAIIPSVLIIYFFLRYLANEDFKKFVPYFEELIKRAKK